MSTLEELQSVIDKSKRIVFFGGAGVSTESGIPDFRSVDGLYNQKYDYPPEQILSHTFFVHKTSEFFRFYRDKMLCLDKKPNKAHYKLAELEKALFYFYCAKNEVDPYPVPEGLFKKLMKRYQQ